ncbi:M90 family metallopeptidase [Pustulibacterium marinum]|nr:M90 family metallopeptidase [Pustulibacterium marinum]
MGQYISVILFAALVLFFWNKRKKKKKVEAFPKKWEPYIQHSVFYKRLPTEEKQQFKNRIMKFLTEVYIEGVQTEVTDEDKVLVAAAAVIPTMGFEAWYYPNLSSVLLYPASFNKEFDFNKEDKERVIMGMVGNGRLKNTMILSKKALHHGFDNESDKLNTGIHEFVHLIDGVDGAVDGVPEQLLQEPNTLPWLKLMHDTMEEINKNQSDIRKYGGTSQQEFFAVASEYFFSRPKLMQRKHPELYAMLEKCFRQDPSDSTRL